MTPVSLRIGVMLKFDSVSLQLSAFALGEEAEATSGNRKMKNRFIQRHCQVKA